MRKYLSTPGGILFGLFLGSALALVVHAVAVQLGASSDNAILRLSAQVLGVGGMFYGGYRGFLRAGGLSRRIPNRDTTVRAERHTG